MPWRRWTIVLFLILTGLCFFSCGGKQDPKVLVIGIPSDTDSFNPLLVRSRFGTELSKMLYSSLVSEESDFVSFQPSLAKSWEFLDDGLRLRFHLQTGLFWSDSVKLTAQDVVFTHGLYTDPEIGWVGASVKADIDNVVAVNDSIIDYYFTKRYPYQIMDANEGVILPQHIFGNLNPQEIKDYDFTQLSVFSGPYLLRNHVSNQHIELSGNPLYYEPDFPKIKRIVFKIVPDKTLLMTQLETGEIHMMDGLPPDQADMSGYSNLTTEHFPYAQFMQIAWNNTVDVFQSVEMRRALTLSIDRRALVDHLLKGYGRVAKGPIHPMLWAYNDNLKTLPYDPDRAAAILKQQGWADSDDNGYLDKQGQELEFNLMTNIGSQVREDALVMIQEMLRQTGIKVVPQRLEWSVYVEKLINREYDGVLLGMMSATKVDVFQVWHSSMTGSDGFNLSCYKNSRVDEIIESAPDIADRQKALPLWTEFQEIIINEQPATFLWIPDRIVGLDSRLSGYRFSPVSTFYNIHQWSWDQ